MARGDRLLVGSTRGLYALDKSSGEIVWHIEARHTLFSPMLADAAYAGSVHGELYAIDPNDGRIEWRRRFPGWVYSPASGDNQDILWTGGQEHRVYALSAADGELLHEIETSQESVFSPVDIGGDRVAFNLFDGSTLVVRATDGEIAGVMQGDSQPGRLTRRGDIVYRTHRDGRLVAFDSVSLRPQWQKQLTGQGLALHPSRSDRLLLSNRESDFVLLDPENPGRPCRIRGEFRALLPLLLETESIIYFKKQLQPPRISLVSITAPCK